MKKEDLKLAFDKIKPSESAKKRMLKNILNYSERKKGAVITLINFKKAVLALTLAVVLAGGLLTYNALYGNYNNDTQPEYHVADDLSQGREDAVAPLLNQFQLGDKHYILLTDDLRADYGLPASVDESDIGEKITDIKTSPDESLIGGEVYSYIPAGGEAIVAVKKDNEYQLFRFFTFESYNNNQDEDAVEYLLLYGIEKADDIAKIQFIGHSEESKLQGRMDIIGEITDRDEIAQFYSYYSVLKNSSDRYFDKLFNFSDTGSANGDIEVDSAAPDVAVPPDQIHYGEDKPMNSASEQPDVAVDLPAAISDKGEVQAVPGDTPIAKDTPASVEPSHGMMDMGDTGSGSSGSNQGTAIEALSNLVTIRIYNQKGIYYDSVYYINLGFISRYEISKEFADFMSRYLY